MGCFCDVVVVGYGVFELEEILIEEVVGQDCYIVLDLNLEVGYFYCFDYIFFVKQGVLMFYVDGGFDLCDGGIEVGEVVGVDYCVNCYYVFGDEYLVDWNMEGMVEDVQFFYNVGNCFVNFEDWLNWYEGNEFWVLCDVQWSEQCLDICLGKSLNESNEKGGLVSCFFFVNYDVVCWMYCGWCNQNVLWVINCLL